MMLLREAADAAPGMFERTAADPDAATGCAPTCFVAATAADPLMLEVAASARHAADAALVLDRCDPLLQMLQDWTGSALDWRWIDPPSWRLSTGTHAAPRWRLDGVAQGRLELPWTLLRGLPAPAAALAASLDWPLVRSVLAVSRFGLGPEELELLEPGGAVVLPESLRAPWRGWLRVAGEPAHAGVGVPVDLSTPAAPRLVPAERPVAAPADGGDGRIACEVRLDSLLALSADRLGGWCDGLALDGVGAAAGLWRCADAHGPARPLAAGRLMPWGDGWALAIELLDDNESTLLPFTA
jgi:hypothetical protein